MPPTLTPTALAADSTDAHAWDRLKAALDAEAAAGRHVDLWWRDDDAGAPSDDLDRLLDLTANAGVPLALAVVPVRAVPALADNLASFPEASILVHGWAHANHAPDSDKQTEIGDHRPLEEVAEELRLGLGWLEVLFGGRALPVVAPPWNRIGPQVMAALPQIGFSGVSQFGREGPPIDGLQEVNVHLDPILWKDGNRFAGVAAMVDSLIAEIAAPERQGRPIGLMTHHWAHGPEMWAFLATMAALVAEHPATAWRSAEEVFGLPPGDDSLPGALS